SNGNLLINSWFETYGGARYYADANGRAKRDQWLNYNGKWYFFDDNGQMVTGSYSINNTEYYFNDNGVLEN
ncbi:MAG: choline-binding protein, partial [Liquorilactobacillus ghanensis]